MAKVVDWTFALRLSGIVPDDLPFPRLTQYLDAWVECLGKDGAAARYRGAVQGSAVLRVQVEAAQCAQVERRLRSAANDAVFSHRLASMLAADGITQATIINRAGDILARVKPKAVAVAELVIYDEVDVDGRVVRVEGKDSTSHIGLLESGTGRAISVQTSSHELAREFAGYYRNGWVRVRTEGMWVRNLDGLWEPKSLTARSLTVLDDTPAQVLLQELAQMPGNGWAAMTRADALACWHQLRGGESEEAAEEALIR